MNDRSPGVSESSTAGLRPFGRTGIDVPPVIFGTSCLGNLYRVLPDQTKQEILREILRCSPAPVVLDSAGKYGAGLALEVLGRELAALGAVPERILISNKLGWRRVPLREAQPTFEPGIWEGLAHDAVQDVSYEGIQRCWEEGLALLGPRFRPALVSVHDPDEYLANAAAGGGSERALEDVLGAYRALHELKRAGAARLVGVGAKDWRVVRRLVDEVELDWVMLACSLTVYSHPPQLVELVATLERRGIAVLNSAILHSGFLTGGVFFDYRRLDPQASEDRRKLEWRARFEWLCTEHGVTPTAACVQFALSPPGVAAVALNTSRPQQVERNLALATAPIDARFWTAMKDAQLIDRAYPYLG